MHHRLLFAVLSVILLSAAAARVQGQPQDLEVVYRQATAFFNEHTYDRAIAGYRDFLKAKPDDARAPEAEYRIGYALLQLRRYKEADQTLRAMLAKHSDDVWGARCRRLLVHLVGRSGWQFGEREKARQFVDEAVAIFRRFPDTKDELIQLLLEAPDLLQNFVPWQKRVELAEYPRQVLTFNPSDEDAARALLKIADIYGDLGQANSKAFQACNTIVDKYPQTAVAPEAQSRIAHHYESKGDYVTAVREYRKVQARYPASKQAKAAEQSIHDITRPYLGLEMNQDYYPGAKIRHALRTRNVTAVALSAYRIDPLSEPVLRRAESGGDEWWSAFANRKPEYGWSVAVADKGDHQWVDTEVPGQVFDPGMYVVIARASGQKSVALTNVSTLVMVEKYDQSTIVAYVADRKSNRPVGNCEVHLLSGGNQSALRETQVKRTDAMGLTKLTVMRRADEAMQYVTVARLGTQYAVVGNAYWYWWNEPGRTPGFYVYTDRPVYRPEQTVHYRAILRYHALGKYENVVSQAVIVRLFDAKGNKVSETQMTTDAFGTVHGDWPIKASAPLGLYRIEVALDKDSGTGQFRVEEYRKPEYKVTVSPPPDRVHPGTTVHATVEAAYYFGAPVPDADVQYTVTRTRYYPYWSYPMPYEWFMGGEGAMPMTRYMPWRYGSDVVKTGEAKTDAAGKAAVEFPTVSDEYDYRYTIAAKVVDRSRREVEGSGEVLVTHTSFYLNVRTAQSLYRLTDKVTADVKAVTPNDQPVQTPLRMTLYKLEPIYEEVSQGAGKTKRIKDWKRDKLWDAANEVKTDAAGLAHFTFRPDMEGYFEIEASAADTEADTRVVGSARFWVASDAWKGATWDNVNLELVTEKDLYEVGETARILVNSPVRDGYVFLTIGARDIYSCRVEEVTGASKVVELPITEQYEPNVFIHAVVVGDGQVFQQTKQLFVPPSRRLMNVKVEPDKSDYRPRDKGRFVVTTTDQHGKPVRAQLSLAVTDESVYYIQEDFAAPIQQFFYGAKLPNSIQTAISLGAYQRFEAQNKATMALGQPVAGAVLAPAMAADNAAMVAGKGEAAGAPAAPVVREFFPDTTYWSPTIETGADGRATVTVAFPDSLTTWRVVARAVTTDSMVGESVTQTVTKKNVIVRLETPRFLVEGDYAYITAIVHNYLANALRCEVKFTCQGVQLEGPETQTVTVAPGGEAVVERRVHATSSGTAVFEAAALSNVESDAVKLSCPVLPHGAAKFQTETGSTTDETTFVMRLPQQRDRNADSLKIYLSPTLGNVLLDSLGYLADYPYGCVEQTMSRFLPAVLVSRTMQDIGYNNASLQQKLPDMIAKGLDRLYTMQHGDGGWGWWSGGSSDLYMTAYVVYGLSMARAADVSVRPDVLSRGVGFLKQAVPDKDIRVDNLAFACYALAVAGSPDAAAVNRVYAQRDDLNDYTRALLALTLATMKDDRAHVVARNMEGFAIETAHGVHWDKQSWGWWWSDDQVEATAYSLQALLAVDPHNRLIPKTVEWLVMNRRGNRWRSTKDTAAAIFALAGYMRTSHEIDANYTAEVEVNGKLVKTLEVTPQNALSVPGVIDVPAALLRDGANTVRIVKKGRGVCYYSAQLTFYSKENFIQGASSVIKVDRRYYLLTPYVDEHQQMQYRREPLGARVASGSLIEVELTITSENEFDYLMFEDYKPAGCEPVDRVSGWQPGDVWCQKELRDDKVVFFIDHLKQGVTRINYRLRAETPGDYSALPHQAQSMYVPEVRALSDERKVGVDAAK